MATRAPPMPCTIRNEAVVDYHRVDYDVEAAQRKIREAGLPNVSRRTPEHRTIIEFPHQRGGPDLDGEQVGPGLRRRRPSGRR